MKKFKFNIAPVAAPRINHKELQILNRKQGRMIPMTDKEKARYKTLDAYMTYKRSLAWIAKQQDFKLPEGNYHVMFYKAMPSSWSRTKRNKMRFSPCQVMPDTDNYLKAFKDALLSQDNLVYDERSSKFWADTGFIEVVIEIPRVSKILSWIKKNCSEEQFEEVLNIR